MDWLVGTQELVREHDFVDGVCCWCGGCRSEFLTARLTCVPRWVDKPPRSTPASIFKNLASIGERMREIQAEEGPSTPAERIPDQGLKPDVQRRKSRP
jgi:hypothetical protein